MKKNEKFEKKMKKNEKKVKKNENFKNLKYVK